MNINKKTNKNKYKKQIGGYIPTTERSITGIHLYKKVRMHFGKRCNLIEIGRQIFLK